MLLYMVLMKKEKYITFNRLCKKDKNAGNQHFVLSTPCSLHTCIKTSSPVSATCDLLSVKVFHLDQHKVSTHKSQEMT